VNAQPSDELDGFLRRQGIRGPVALNPVLAGRNSRVTRVSNPEGIWILKQYDPATTGASGAWDRLGTEFGFLEYLEGEGLGLVPRPLGVDRRLGIALYSFLPGERLATVSDDHLQQAARFILAINRTPPTDKAGAIHGAADACIHWNDHLSLVGSRMTALRMMQPGSAVETAAAAMVENRLVPLWETIRRSLRARVAVDPTPAPILSPSDFGFHNALLHDGVLSFVDFEYAGWDGPVKLICDFLCQPAIPVDPARAHLFIDTLVEGSPKFHGLRELVHRWLPAHRLKWCCILLNEFRPAYLRRRLHAGLAADGLLTSQLDKAQRYLDENLDASLSALAS
jgi:hypothetical protein